MHLPDAVIVLAGGTAKRLGGVSKPDYKIGNARLIDIVLDEIERTGFDGRIVVVAPSELAVREGVELTLENPPHGGPLAGLAAGVAALNDLPGSAIVALMTCDAPMTPRLWGELCSKIDEAQASVPVPKDARAWPQFLHGCYRLAVLREVPAERNGSIRHGFAALEPVKVVDRNWYCMDVDTPADAKELAVRIGTRLV
ncbi:molybdenum cofactor guanylyltransferase [Actinomyces urinae]|uniref:molybdenum cofactor guanylyltransferase n=1 Tax=Actinomyces urinae TaxID=1689268 RepID=UPI0009311ECE|nr:NTP transferase domain-containing protein [Actinomyces urinae]